MVYIAKILVLMYQVTVIYILPLNVQWHDILFSYNSKKSSYVYKKDNSILKMLHLKFLCKALFVAGIIK